MKRNILRLSIIALTSISAIVVIATVRAQKFSNNMSASAPSSWREAIPSQTPAASQEQTVEQLQKNIKVLNGMPYSQFLPVMNFFATSMGRRCNFCHVNTNGQWDYASDAKPEKNTAREMIKLVLDTNNRLTQLKLDPISCYTCHRGRNTPQSIPMLPLPMPSPPPNQNRPGGPAAPGVTAQASPNPTPALPSADDIFNKYIAAIGGQAAIDKLASRMAKGAIAQANGNSFQFELYQSAPDKFYLIVTTPQGTLERGYNGQVGWEKTARGVRQISGSELATYKAANALFSFINLKDQFARTPRVRKDKLNDRDVYVLDGAATDGRRMRLYFDATTGLLLRRITILSTIVGLIPEQVDFEDYRDVEGVKFAFTGRSSTIEAGNPVSIRTFTEVKLNAPVEASKFNMPAAAKP